MVWPLSLGGEGWCSSFFLFEKTMLPNFQVQHVHWTAIQMQNRKTVNCKIVNHGFLFYRWFLPSAFELTFGAFCGHFSAQIFSSHFNTNE